MITDKKQELYEEFLDEMVNKFLCWKLPEDFHPDSGISFEKKHGHETPHWPTGTNILTAEQAKEMFKHCISMTLYFNE